jgi:hypothetical protein
MNTNEMRPLLTFTFEETNLDKTALMEEFRNILLDSAEGDVRGKIEVKEVDREGLGEKGSFVFHVMVHLGTSFGAHAVGTPELLITLIAQSMVYFAEKHNIVISLEDKFDEKFEIHAKTLKEEVEKFLRKYFDNNKN